MRKKQTCLWNMASRREGKQKVQEMRYLYRGTNPKPSRPTLSTQSSKPPFECKRHRNDRTPCLDENATKLPEMKRSERVWGISVLPTISCYPSISIYLSNRICDLHANSFNLQFISMPYSSSSLKLRLSLPLWLQNCGSPLPLLAPLPPSCTPGLKLCGLSVPPMLIMPPRA